MNILVIGSTGQIGSELTMRLREHYGAQNVVAGYIPAMPPKGELKESGPSEVVDITDATFIAAGGTTTSLGKGINELSTVISRKIVQ